MKFKEFVKTFVNTTKITIANLETYKELTGVAKKAQLDLTITNWVNVFLKDEKLNVFVKWIIKTFVIKNIPDITQAIFDLIKSRVEGITAEKAA